MDNAELDEHSKQDSSVHICGFIFLLMLSHSTFQYFFKGAALATCSTTAATNTKPMYQCSAKKSKSLVPANRFVVDDNTFAEVSLGWSK